MQEALEVKLEFDSEIVEIWRFGVNDYAINFLDGDYSIRGTYAEIAYIFCDWMNTCLTDAKENESEI